MPDDGWKKGSPGATFQARLVSDGVNGKLGLPVRRDSLAWTLSGQLVLCLGPQPTGVADAPFLVSVGYVRASGAGVVL